MKQQVSKKKKTAKYVVFSLLGLLGTVIIIFASMVIYHLFFTRSVQGGNRLSDNLSDMMLLYEDSQALRDMPTGLEIADSTCDISDDQKSYTYTLTIKNTSTVQKDISLQVFAGLPFVAAYGNRVANPILQVLEEEEKTIEAGEEQRYSFTGVVYGTGDEAVSKLKEKFAHVYFEVIYSLDLGRIELPVRFV